MNYLTLPGAVLLGLAAGWLVNYLSDVLPPNRRLTAPMCTHCRQRLPLITYLLYRSCPACHKKRGLRACLVQVAFPLIYVWLVLRPPERLNFWVAAGLLVYLGVVAVIDLEYRVILHPVSLVGAGLGLALGWSLRGLVITALGGLAGFLIMLALYYLGIGFTRLLGKIRRQEIEEEALGFGDVNLCGVLGLILGWPGITAALILAILLSGIFSGGYILAAKLSHRYQMFTAIPYAPFLILGTVILLYHN